jgi:hypothetical protein
MIKLYTKEANEMVWGDGNKALKANIQNLPNDTEERHFLLTIHNAENKVVFSKTLYINTDMWGSGFVKAMQVDDDPEFEIVFYVYHSPEFNSQHFQDDAYPIRFNFYLDINPETGQIRAKDFNAEASYDAKKLAERVISTSKPLTLILFLIFVLPVISIFAGILGKCIVKDRQATH